MGETREARGDGGERGKRREARGDGGDGARGEGARGKRGEKGEGEGGERREAKGGEGVREVRGEEETTIKTDRVAGVGVLKGTAASGVLITARRGCALAQSKKII
jgi:hypothetical protein